MDRCLNAFAACALCLVWCCFSAIWVHAEELSSSDILQGLTHSSGMAVRGRALPVLTDDEKEYLRKLPSRGLARLDVEKVGKLIDQVRPPSIDIEINFDYKSASITQGSAEQLDMLGHALLEPQLSTSRIALNGHTDARGGDEYNLKLSDARAGTVRDYLLAHFSIPAAQLLAIGFGKTRLKDPEDPEGAENRRVEVVNLGQ